MTLDEEAQARFSKAPGEAELRKVERLLHRMAPQHRQRWANLLNALLIEVENHEVSGPVLHAIQHALIALVGGGAAGNNLRRSLQFLVQAATLPADTNPRVGPDEKGNEKSYTLGDGMVEFIVHLRFDLGLSALYVSRHLRDYHRAPTPPGALLALIAGVRDPALGPRP